MSRNSNAVEGATVTQLDPHRTISITEMVALKFKEVADLVVINEMKALKFKEAAMLLSVSEDSIRRAVNEGRLPAVQILGGPRILRQDLDPYLAAHPYEPAA